MVYLFPDLLIVKLTFVFPSVPAFSGKYSASIVPSPLSSKEKDVILKRVKWNFSCTTFETKVSANALHAISTSVGTFPSSSIFSSFPEDSVSTAN